MTIFNECELLTITDLDVLNGFLDDESISDIAEIYDINCLMAEDILRQILFKIALYFEYEHKQVKTQLNNVDYLKSRLSVKQETVNRLELQNKILEQDVKLLTQKVESLKAIK